MNPVRVQSRPARRKGQPALTLRQRQCRKQAFDRFIMEVTRDPHFGKIELLPLADGSTDWVIWLSTVCEMTGLLPGEIGHAMRGRGLPSPWPFPRPVRLRGAGAMVWRNASVMAWLAANPVERCFLWPLASLGWRPRAVPRSTGRERFQVIAPWWEAKTRRDC